MAQYIDKSTLVAEIDRLDELNIFLIQTDKYNEDYKCGYEHALEKVRDFLNTLEVKEMDLVIYTIIAECCDWLAMNTNLSHDKIEGCRNLMLIVKDEQLKAHKGE